MNPGRLSRPFDPPSPPREQSTSPKRKRADDAGEDTTVHSGARRLSPRRIADVPAPREITEHNNLHDYFTTEEEVNDFLRSCDARFARNRVLRERHESTLKYRLFDAITATQVTQARAGSDLLKLSNTLHDFARHLNEQESYLRQQQARLITQETDMSRKLLDAVTKQLETNFNIAENSTGRCQAEELAELKHNNEHLEYNISVHQTTIEVLLSELMIEREARRAAEAKLQVEDAMSGDLEISTVRKNLWGDEVDPISSSTPMVFSMATSPAQADITRIKRHHFPSSVRSESGPPDPSQTNSSPKDASVGD